MNKIEKFIKQRIGQVIYMVIAEFIIYNNGLKSGDVLKLTSFIVDKLLLYFSVFSLKK